MTEKLFYKNQYLKELETKVVKFGELDNKPFVILEETIFYPEGGGQPSDTGYINDAKVIDVQEINREVYHFLENKIEDKYVKCKICWEKRFDYMQQHTGQHILSGLAYQFFNAQTVGFHLGSEDTTVDLSRSEFSKKELDLLEEKANEYVTNNHKIIAFFPDSEKIKSLNLRKSPKNYEKIRIVNVKDLDFSPCGGTHFNSTAEVGLIKIVSTEKIRGNTRLHILCGNRALKDYIKKTNIVNNLIEITNSPQNEILSSIESTYEGNKEMGKEINILKEDLAVEIAKNYYKRTDKTGDTSLLIFNNEDFSPLQFRAIANYFQEKDKMIGFIYSKENGSFILFKSKLLDIDLKKLFTKLKEDLQCKGGGSSDIIQGKLILGKFDLINQTIKNIIVEML